MVVKSEEEIEGDTTKGEKKREREACNREKEMAGEKKRNSNRGTTRCKEKRRDSWKEEERPVS